MKTRYDVVDKGIVIDSEDQEGNIFKVNYMGSESVKSRIAAMEHAPGIQKTLRKGGRAADDKREEIHRSVIAEKVFAIAGHFKSPEHRLAAQERGKIVEEDILPGFLDVEGNVYEDSLENRQKLVAIDAFVSEVILPTATDRYAFGVGESEEGVQD